MAEEKQSQAEIDRAEIRMLLAKVPAGSTEWSYQRAVDYKEAASAAAKAAYNRRAKPETLRVAMQELKGFYE